MRRYTVTVNGTEHVIDVDEHTARWLTDHQIGEPASHRPEPAPDAPDASVKSAKTLKE